jgi:hypothetical protein
VKHHTFVAASQAADLPAQLRLARETARQLVLNGVVDGENVLNAINELAGGGFEANLTTPGGDVWSDFCRHVDAAFALGIVVGQLVHPDVFKNGGDR